MWKMKKFTNLQPCKWLSSWQRKNKVDNWQTQAAAQEEENSSSSAAVAQQEKTEKKKSSQVHTIWVKPFYPEVLLDPHTGCQEGPGFPSSVGIQVVEEADTDLHSSCPTLAGPTDSQAEAAALTRAPEEEEHCTPVTAKVQEAAKTSTSPALGEQATAAGPGSQAAALHTPFCSPSPSPIQLEANGLSEQWARAAAKTVLPVPEAEEGAFSKLGRDLNVYSPQELPPRAGERSGDQSWSSREKGFPVAIPREVLAESRDLQGPTPRARAPVRRSSSPYIRPQAPTPDRCALSPSPCELETLSGQCGGVWSSEVWDISRESQGQEHTHQPLSQEEDSNDNELSQDNWEDIKIYTIWVKPSLIPILLEPQTGGQEGPKCPCTICREAAEQTDSDQHSTAAGAESQAAALHSSPCPASPSPSQLAALSEQWAVAAVGAFLPVAQTKETAWSEDGSLWDISSLLERCQEEENTAESWNTGGATSSVSLPCGPRAEPWDAQEGTSTDNDLGAVRDMGPSNPNQQFYMGTDMDLTEEGLFQPRQSAKQNSQEQQAVRGATCLEDLLVSDRQSFERWQVEPSPTAVSAQRPSLFREALRALRRAFCWPCLADWDGGSQGVAVTAPTST
ncbi:uncharacterized protein LOC116786425 isoform X2 [Chiroxiphia lanceolata]|uniref:uncharacterized protein LOC116786425 isoform X2 n=1 Tax=Chiroxiphia lanceolata TaxID=296741 RepID=UPI0013CEAA90|nr:uncharacterized protein LOC116786425 isoform X2 [Chiroxiphia lanceolata]